MEMESESRKKFGLVTLSWSFFLGWVAGMGLMAFYTSQPGRQTRQKIGDATAAMGNKTSSYLRQAKGRISSTVGEGRDMVGREVAGLKSAVAAGKEAYREGKERNSKK